MDWYCGNCDSSWFSDDEHTTTCPECGVPLMKDVEEAAAELSELAEEVTFAVPTVSISDAQKQRVDERMAERERRRREMLEAIKRQPTCVWYVPSEQQAAEGAKPNDSWEYNRLMPFQTCTNPKVIGQSPYGPCGAFPNMGNCPVYKAEDGDILEREVRLVDDRPGAPQIEVAIKRQRVGCGLPSYLVVSHPLNDPTNETVHHSVSADTENSREVVAELYRLTRDEIGGTEVQPEHGFSYIQSVVLGSGPLDDKLVFFDAESPEAKEKEEVF